MRFTREYGCLVAKVSAVLCMVLIPGGCSWLDSGSSVDDWDLTEVQRDSLGMYFRDYAKMSRENERLRNETRSQELDLAKLRAEYQRQKEFNDFLSEEIEHLKRDLDRAEKQFISFEKRLQVKETKASAVAAIAEVQMLFERLRKDSDGLDSVTVEEVNEKLGRCDELVKERNYPAAVYYANRAMRILNQSERRNNIGLSDGDTRVIAVSRANLRDGPGSRYKVVDKLKYGTIIVQMEAKQEWCKVRTASGKSGWIHSSLIR